MSTAENNHGILVFDKHKILTYANASAEALFPKPLSIGGPACSIAGFSGHIEMILDELMAPGQTTGRIIEIPACANEPAKRIRAIGISLPQQNSVFLETLDGDCSRILSGESKREAEHQSLIKRNQELESAWEELAAELEMAREIQQSILPRNLPVVPGYEFAAEYLPSRKVGGDFYNLVQLDPDHLLIVEADVSGHGIPAAFITTIGKTAFDRNMRCDRSLASNLWHMNQELCDQIKTEHYMTAFVAVLNIATGSLAYCRICHPYPIIFRKKTGEIEYLKTRGGFFLGMMKEENEFIEEQTALYPGDKLLIYTDGLNEAFNGENSQYGRDRLAASGQRHAGCSAIEFLGNIMRDRESFMKGMPNSDDITALVVGRKS